MVGLSDEAGAGANVGLAAKARHAPTALEVVRVDDYIQHTLWGIERDIPYNVSLQDHVTGGIRASLFWVPTPVSALYSITSCRAKVFHTAILQRKTLRDMKTCEGLAACAGMSCSFRSQHALGRIYIWLMEAAGACGLVAVGHLVSIGSID